MKFVKIAVVVAVAAMLSGCCALTGFGGGLKGKCYPYPLYDYSPAKICGAACPAPCAPAPCAPMQ